MACVSRLARGLAGPRERLRSGHVEELARRAHHLRRVGRHVAPADARREVDLDDGAAREVDRQSQQRDHRAAAVDVRARVLRHDLDQLLLLRDQLAGADLRLRLPEEVLLARGAHDVGVGVAVADVVERVLAAQLLVAGVDVDRRVLVVRVRVVVEVAAVDVGVDAADRVHRLAEAAEVDVDHVVDAQPGDLLDRLQQEPRPP